ncbi:MAG: macro domain-containing protein [Nanoarchaeota archaeon]|nr:macro domain-containing protein [Nanoarchaeota archaeon]
MNITIVQGSILHEEVDAIVCPANSACHMGGEVGGFIKKVGGDEIEEEAISHAPVNVGKAVYTKAGVLKCRFVIHAPTMEEPGQKTDEQAVKHALEAALEIAEELGIRSIAIPGMGTGTGRVDFDEAAKVMFEVLNAHETESLEEVILVDVNEKMVKAWKKYQ